jgi:hypothetical protein
MTVIPRSSPTGYAIFCDEVRREDNGKHIHLGVYVGEMVINAPSFPVRLPRLSVVINYYETVGESTEPVRFAVFLPGEQAPAGEFTINKPEGPIPPPPAPEEGEQPGEPLFHVAIVLDIQDPVFKQEGRIRVRAFRGDDEIRLGTLTVRFHRMDAPPPPPEQTQNRPLPDSN